MILPCDAVLFDVDGTLIDSTPLVEEAARQWAPGYGIDPDEFLADAHGRRTADRVADFLPPDRVAAASAHFEALEDALTDGIAPLPGAVDLLAGMSGPSCAFVTSMHRAQLEKRIEAAGIPLPPVAVTADDVGRGEPDPSGYRQAARRLGVDPARCVLVEDAPAGVAAGRAAGAVVLAVLTSHPPQELTAADHVVENLTRVTAAPEGLRLAGWADDGGRARAPAWRCSHRAGMRGVADWLPSMNACSGVGEIPNRR